LVEAFGGPVASLVREVTDDKRLPKTERKLRQVEHAAHLSPKARAVKLADKIANLRDATAVLSTTLCWPSGNNRFLSEAI
jgi:guanosine-3',5'-bis(diphosphate) 3'-pyrophosphohydrolase